MERDYEFSSRLHFADLDLPDAIGRKAAERAVERLNPAR
jgi:PmbA protein